MGCGRAAGCIGSGALIPGWAAVFHPSVIACGESGLSSGRRKYSNKGARLLGKAEQMIRGASGPGYQGRLGRCFGCPFPARLAGTVWGGLSRQASQSAHLAAPVSPISTLAHFVVLSFSLFHSSPTSLVYTSDTASASPGSPPSLPQHEQHDSSSGARRCWRARQAGQCTLSTPRTGPSWRYLAAGPWPAGEPISYLRARQHGRSQTKLRRRAAVWGLTAARACRRDSGHVPPSSCSPHPPRLDILPSTPRLAGFAGNACHTGKVGSNRRVDGLLYIWKTVWRARERGSGSLARLWAGKGA